MLTLLLRRLLSAVVLLGLLSLLVFVLLDVMEGDAAIAVAGDNATPQDVAAARERLGLDDPLPVHYVAWLGGAVRGDLGVSLLSGRPVAGLIADRVPVTASLAAVSLVIALAAGVPLGIAAAVRANRTLDRAVTAVSSVTMAAPPFVVGLVLVLVFAVGWQMLPATGYAELGDEGVLEWLRHLVLPALALAAISAAEFARQTRAAMVDTLGQDFVRTASRSGCSPGSSAAPWTPCSAGSPTRCSASRHWFSRWPSSASSDRASATSWSPSASCSRPRLYRLSLAAARSVSTETYIEACRAMGCSPWRLLWRHVLPNAGSPLLVQLAFSAGVVVIAEASLSFLGLGVQPPEASWGSMLRDAFDAIYDSPWFMVAPAVMIIWTILSTAVLGDALRDALEGRGSHGSARHPQRRAGDARVHTS